MRKNTMQNEKNRGTRIQDRGNPPQQCVPSTQGPADFSLLYTQFFAKKNGHSICRKCSTNVLSIESFEPNANQLLRKRQTPFAEVLRITTVNPRRFKKVCVFVSRPCPLPPAHFSSSGVPFGRLAVTCAVSQPIIIIILCHPIILCNRATFPSNNIIS